MKIKPFAELRPYNQQIDFWFATEDKGTVAEPLVFKKHDEALMVQPTMSMKTEDAQLLMDELWRCGLRPSEGTGSAGALAATERHLKDMQKLVFGEG